MTLPSIIQGGMGAGVSDWKLARSVSLRGQIGVVSGTALDLILVRRLQNGDEGGHMRRALAAFPDQEIAQGIIDRFFIEDGRADDRPFANKPMVGHDLTARTEDLIVVANFAEIYLAKEGHSGMVGVNYLHKIQAPTLPSLYGAMLAQVDAVLMGAGIPIDIPDFLDRLSRSEAASMKLQVNNAARGTVHLSTFDPSRFTNTAPRKLKKPLFFPIVSSVTLASLCIKKCPGQIDGLIIEAPTAGGHNAPPRGKTQFNEKGEPIYGARDEVDLAAIKALGLPFWLAGSRGSPDQLADALSNGATGIQVGTLFAFCNESGLRADIKQSMIQRYRRGTANVFTDPIGSPTGFPFKVLELEDTLSESEVYAERKRVCDLGYLRSAYEKEDGSLGWRCPAEPIKTYLKSGGSIEETEGKKCLCNGLFSNIGLQQVRPDKKEELPLVTCGDDLSGIFTILDPSEDRYPASAVIDYLLGRTSSRRETDQAIDQDKRETPEILRSKG
jgi:nitronate monooxygenase